MGAISKKADAGSSMASARRRALLDVKWRLVCRPPTSELGCFMPISDARSELDSLEIRGQIDRQDASGGHGVGTGTAQFRTFPAAHGAEESKEAACSIGRRASLASPRCCRHAQRQSTICRSRPKSAALLPRLRRIQLDRALGVSMRPERPPPSGHPAARRTLQFEMSRILVEADGFIHIVSIRLRMRELVNTS